MEPSEFEEIDKRAHELVEKAHASLRETPLEATFPEGIRKDILCGTRFTVTNIDYRTNVVTFSLTETTQ